MTDLRQGVTPTQHEVLDIIEAKAAEWSELLAKKRQLAIEAAVHLIDAADDIGRLIGAIDP